MTELVTEAEAQEADDMLSAVRAVLDGRDPDLITAVLSAALLEHALAQATQEEAEAEIQAIGGEALDQIAELWPQREVLLAGGLN